MKSVYLYPGQIHATDEAMEITTILGSCVAVAMYDAHSGIGGLNHFLLDRPPFGEQASPRYGSTSLPALLEALLSLGAARNRLAAKVFGGANVLNDIATSLNIGDKNVEFALAWLEEMKIPVLEKDTGGTVGRRIQFSTGDFAVQSRLMREKDTEVSGHAKLEIAPEVRVAVVDDSLAVRNLFLRIFSKHGLQVVGTAANAFEARDLIVKQRPSVITLDVEMPGMSGVAFLEKLMKHLPVPTVMVSSLASDGEAALRALDLGAVEFVTKPSQFDTGALGPFAETLVEKIRAAASVNVIRARRAAVAGTPAAAVGGRSGMIRRNSGGEIRAMVVGGNTGSQDSLAKLLSGLAPDSPPVVVANSGIVAFLASYVERLRKSCSLDIRIAQPGAVLSLGTVYLAGPGAHIGVARSGNGLVLTSCGSVPVCNQVPSSNVLFESAVKSAGSGAAGVLLGGYGTDGVDGLIAIRDAGGIAIAEDPELAQFPYLPQKAIALGAVDQVTGADRIPALLLQYRSARAA